MPAKKKTTKESESFDLQRIIQNSDSYKSLVYGIVTVVVLFIVIALGVRTLSQNRAQIDENAAMSDQSSDVLTENYTVSEGETLWSIAEKTYNDGYAWTEIAKANNLKEPYDLEKGQKLILPKRNPTPTSENQPSPTAVPTVTAMVTKAPVENMQEVNNGSVGEKISGNTYKVVKGDNLWDIAVRAYGDGYRWVEIARLNSLANPDLIHSGNELKLPRP